MNQQARFLEGQHQYQGTSISSGCTRNRLGTEEDGNDSGRASDNYSLATSCAVEDGATYIQKEATSCSSWSRLNCFINKSVDA